jgi:Sec-independent protein secretion pathway component TatC
LSSGKGLQLERDAALPVQNHLDTLTQKATLWFVLITILTFGFITKIDGILEATLDHLNPCDKSSCLTLYEPASWSVVRWLSSVFISILCILPLVLTSMYSFAKPGLTQSEKSMLKRWMITSSTLGYCSLIFLFLFFIPYLYELGDSIHSDMGLTSQYDAVSLFTLALSIFWALLITYIIAFGTTTAGALGLITDNNQDWWRIRILGIGSVVLLLSLPGRWNGANIVLLSTMVVFLEYSIRKSVRVSREIMKPTALFDHEGRRRFVTYVDCSCQGVAYPIDTSPKYTGLLKYEALCENLDEREHLIDTIARYRLTDVIIGGCDASPLPTSFHNTAQSAQCKLRGLDLLGLQGAIPTENQQLREEVRIHIENLTDPWSSTQRIESCSRKFKEAQSNQFMSVSTQTWPEMEDGILRISTNNWTVDEIEALHSMQS